MGNNHKTSLINLNINEFLISNALQVNIVRYFTYCRQYFVHVCMLHSNEAFMKYFRKQ